jgi:hypothetical protein
MLRLNQEKREKLQSVLRSHIESFNGKTPNEAAKLATMLCNFQVNRDHLRQHYYKVEGITYTVIVRKPRRKREPSPEASVTPVAVDFLSAATSVAAPMAEAPSADEWHVSRLLGAHGMIVATLMNVREVMQDLGVPMPVVSIT